MLRDNGKLDSVRIIGFLILFLLLFISFSIYLGFQEIQKRNCVPTHVEDIYINMYIYIFFQID